MRSDVLALLLVLACLLTAMSLPAWGLELGPQLALSVPTGSAGDTYAPGVGGGLTATFMHNPVAGVGLDLGYHHWPGASDAEAEFDAWLSRLSGRTITGTKWSLGTFEVAGYGRVVAPVRGPVVPWLRAGVAYYYLRHHLELMGQAADDTDWQFGYIGGVGFDVRATATMKLGLDATYRYLMWEDDAGQRSTAYTIGAHLLFSPR